MGSRSGSAHRYLPVPGRSARRLHSNRQPLAGGRRQKQVISLGAKGRAIRLPLDGGRLGRVSAVAGAATSIRLAGNRQIRGIDTIVGASAQHEKESCPQRQAAMQAGRKEPSRPGGAGASIKALYRCHRRFRPPLQSTRLKLSGSTQRQIALCNWLTVAPPKPILSEKPKGPARERTRECAETKISSGIDPLLLVSRGTTLALLGVTSLAATIAPGVGTDFGRSAIHRFEECRGFRPARPARAATVAAQSC
jgi:hypothetical protein